MNRQNVLRTRALCVALVSIVGSHNARAGTTAVVTSCLDDGDGTLRRLVALAAGGDTIDLTHLSCSRITLLTGSIKFPGGDLSIVGPGQNNLTVDGANHDRVFMHNGPGSLTLSNLTVAHGHVQNVGSAGSRTQGGCVYGSDDVVLDHVAVDSCTIDGRGLAGTLSGAAVAAVRGALTLKSSSISNVSTPNAEKILGVAASSSLAATVTDSTISGVYGSANTSAYGGCLVAGGSETTVTHSIFTNCHLYANSVANGGGISTTGLRMTFSTVSSNSVTTAFATASGGGIWTHDDASIDGSSIDDNRASALGTSYGGGISIGGTGVITASTFDHNQADIGAGIAVSIDSGRSLTLIDSTVSTNNAAYGCGGIYATVPFDLSNSTIAFNTSESAGGGGICPHGGLMISQSSIVAANTTAGVPLDIDGTGGRSLSIGGANNLIGSIGPLITLPVGTRRDNPLLLPLADNGGPTLTHALDPTSPAIDAGNDSSGVTSDQRRGDFLRVFGSHADIGAFELQPFDRLFANGFEANR